MFVTESRHQKALAEIESLQAQLDDSRHTVQILDEKLAAVRRTRAKLLHENACLTALCQYLPEGTYSIVHQYTCLDGTITHHGTSVTVDHKATKNASRNYMIKHEPLPVDVQRILVDLQRTLKQVTDAYNKIKQEQIAADYIGWYERVAVCGLKCAALNAQIVCLKQKIKLIELELS